MKTYLRKHAWNFFIEILFFYNVHSRACTKMSVIFSLAFHEWMFVITEEDERKLKNIYCISTNSFQGNYSFLNLALVTVKKLFKGGNIVILNPFMIYILNHKMVQKDLPYESPILGQAISVLGNLDPYSGTWTRTWEPGPVLGNLDLYLGTWTRTWEPILVYVFKSWPNIGDSYGKLLLQHFLRTDASKKTGFYGKMCIKACLEIEKKINNMLQSPLRYFISIELNKSFTVLCI